MGMQEEGIRKIKHLIDTKFHGNYKKCFDHYDRLSLHNNNLSKGEIVALLRDADIGYGGWMRGKIAKEIIKAADINKDNEISWEELRKLVGAPPQ